jgi:hypothetical protein
MPAFPGGLTRAVEPVRNQAMTPGLSKAQSTLSITPQLWTRQLHFSARPVHYTVISANLAVWGVKPQGLHSQYMWIYMCLQEERLANCGRELRCLASGIIGPDSTYLPHSPKTHIYTRVWYFCHHRSMWHLRTRRMSSQFLVGIPHWCHMV